MYLKRLQNAKESPKIWSHIFGTGIHSVCMYVQIYVYVHENAHICICIYIYIGRFLKQIACLWVQQIFPLAEMTDHKINI